MTLDSRLPNSNSRIKPGMKQIWKHPWIVAACNLLLVMVIYTISRLFFYWVNMDMYPHVSANHLLEMLIGGSRFDLTALLYLNSLYLLLVLLPLPAQIRNHKKYLCAAKWAFWLPNIQPFSLLFIFVKYNYIKLVISPILLLRMTLRKNIFWVGTLNLLKYPRVFLLLRKFHPIRTF